MSIAIRTVAITLAALGLVSCADTPNQPPPGSAPCTDFSFQVYFNAGSDQLTTPALEAISVSSSAAKSCRWVSMTIVDHVGANAGDLASRRSAAILKALTADGVSAPQPELRNAETGGMQLLHRRVDVVVHATPAG